MVYMLRMENTKKDDQIERLMESQKKTARIEHSLPLISNEK